MELSKVVAPVLVNLLLIITLQFAVWIVFLSRQIPLYYRRQTPPEYKHLIKVPGVWELAKKNGGLLFRALAPCVLVLAPALWWAARGMSSGMLLSFLGWSALGWVTEAWFLSWVVWPARYVNLGDLYKKLQESK